MRSLLKNTRVSQNDISAIHSLTERVKRFAELTPGIVLTSALVYMIANDRDAGDDVIKSKIDDVMAAIKAKNTLLSEGTISIYFGAE